MSRKRKLSGHSVSGKARRWIDSFDAVSKWMSQYDILQRLKQNEIVKINNFLPDYVAEEALRILESIPSEKWLDTSADEDYSKNNIEHRFQSSKSGSSALEDLLRVFSVLLPDQLNVFSAAKYMCADGIDPHDDKAFTMVRMNDSGKEVECSRDVTLVYYLTKDWTQEMGGAFVDLQTGTHYVPEFNSAVLFKVPRRHMVQKVAGQRPRFSIFGWFLVPGRLYSLQDDDPQTPASKRSRKRLISKCAKVLKSV